MSKRSEMLRQKNRLAAEEEARRQLSRAHTLGVSRGAYALCQVVLNKANNTEMTPEDRLADIIQFCEKARNPDVTAEAEQKDDANVKEEGDK